MQLESENDALRAEVRRLGRQLKVLEEAMAVAMQDVQRSHRTEVLVRRDVMRLPYLPH